MAERDQTLTREDALILLDELRSALPELEAGDLPKDTSERVSGLVRGLHRLPLPAEVLESHLGKIQGWTDALMAQDTEEEPAGTGSIPTLLESRIQRLRMMVDAGVGS
jgi:hypothetical protein